MRLYERVIHVFERFTDQARRVVTSAQSEAERYERVGTEHLLLGLLDEKIDGVSCKALNSMGITFDAARATLVSICGQGELVANNHTPFTPRHKKVLELSLREALQLGDNYVGTEHLLLGLIREGDGKAAEIILMLNGNLNEVRRATIELLSQNLRTPGQTVPAGVKMGRTRADIVADIQSHEVALQRLQVELEECKD